SQAPLHVSTTSGSCSSFAPTSRSTPCSVSATESTAWAPSRRQVCPKRRRIMRLFVDNPRVRCLPSATRGLYISTGFHSRKAMTFYEAALRILETEGRPLHFLEITEKSIAQNLLSHVGKMPEQTMLSRLAAMAKRTRDRRVMVTARDT